MVESKERISVIVPVYNLGSLLPRTIESIQNQQYSNLEIIIVDDGSEDNSADIILSFASNDPRIVPVLKEHEGVGKARLEGCRKATGDYVGFVDGDDLIEEDMYKMLLENAIIHSADISHCGYQMVFPDGRVNYFYNTQRLVIQNTSEGISDLLEGSFIEPTLCTKLYKRELITRLLESNVIDESIRINEDLLMNYFLFSYAKKSVFYDVCKYHYLIRSHSSSRAPNTKNKIEDPIRVKEIILKDVPENLKRTAECALVNTCLNVYNSLIQTDDDYRAHKTIILEKIRNHESSFSSLSNKRRLMAALCSYIPKLYETLYRLYAKFEHKSKYQ